MRSFFVFPVFFCLFSFFFSGIGQAQDYPGAEATGATAAGYSGYSGGDQATPARPQAEYPPVPPVFSSPLAPAPQAQAAPPAAEEPQAADPCKDYMHSYDAYNGCHDRMIKIQRMKDAKGKRKSRYEAPAKPAAVVPAAAPEKTAVDAAPAADSTEAPAAVKTDASATEAPSAPKQ